MSSPSRRALLAALTATVTTTTGCQQFGRSGTSPGTGSGTAPPSSTNGSPTESAEPTTATGSTPDDPVSKTASVGESVAVDGRTVTLQSADATRFLLVGLAGVHTVVAADRDRQYVVVELQVSGSDAQRTAENACRLRIDGGVVHPVAAAVDPLSEPTHVGFELPLDVDPGDLTLVWTGDETTVTWSLPAAVGAHLASPAAFEVREFDARKGGPNDVLEVSFVVANVGESPGAFVAELGWAELSDQPEISVPVDAGAVKMVGEKVPIYWSGEERTVVLDWGWDRIERTIAPPE